MRTAQKALFYLTTMLPALLCCFDTASAQSNTLTASPSQLTFNTQPGVTPVPQSLLVSSSSGTTSISVATSGNPWLFVSPLGGTTPLSLTVSVGAGAPSSGTDVGFVNISAPGAFLSVAVILNVNSSGTSPLSVSPNSLSFTFPANATVPVTQTVTVTSNNSSFTSFTATPITNNGGNWLSVSPTSGSLSGTPLSGSLQVTANPAVLSGPGPFNAVVAINPPGTTGISLPVLVTLSGAPTINVSPAQLSFAWQTGTSAPASQSLSITSSTGATVGFTATAKTATCGNSWLVISPQSGATPGTISAQVNTSGLTGGQCSGEIDISAPGATNPSVAVQVSLLVSVNPLLLVPSTGPTFNYQIGTSTQLAAQNVQITSSSTALNFTATATPVSGAPNFLTINPNSGTTPAALSLTVNGSVLATLGPGTYGEMVSVLSAGAGNSPQSFPVTLVVSSNAVLIANVLSLNFNYQIGQTAPPSQTITVASTGAPLSFQLAANTSNCPGFLSATANGGVAGLTFGGQNQVVVSVTVAGLTPQVCSGNITLTVPGSTSPPVVIPVSLNISNTALLNVSSAAINVTALVGGQATFPVIAVTSTDGSILTFNAIAATNPIGLTWLSVTPNSGNTPSNLQITINPANLAVGTYSGTITVSSTAPNVPAQTVPVTLVIVSSTISANPASLTFTQSLGGTQPPSQTVQISGAPPGTTVGAVSTTFNGTGWLSASVSGSSVTVSVNGSQLAQGAYSGVVTVIVPGAGGSPLYISVTLTVTANGLAVSASTVNFSYQIGGSISPAQTVQVTSTGGSVPYNAVFTPSTGGNFVIVTQSGPNTPGTLTLTLTQSAVTTLAAGSYSGAVVVSSSSIPGGAQSIKVNLSVLAAAPPAIFSVTSGASFVPGAVSPGELITIFGTGLGPSVGIGFTPNNGRVDTTLGGTMVMFGNVPAPLTYVSSTQVNAIVPYEVASNAVTSMTVFRGGTASAMTSLQVVPTTPAIFSADQTGNGQGAILNADLSPNSARNPVIRGASISIYATGEGALTPFVPTGSISGPSLPLPKPIASVSVTIGGQPAPTSYAGEAPGLVSGVLQVNAMVPANIGSGPQTVVLTIGTSSNLQQTITVAVQ